MVRAAANTQTRTRRFATLRIAFIALVIALISAVGVWQVIVTSAQPGPMTRVQISGPDSAQVNEAIDIALVVHHARNIGGYETTAEFDGADVRLIGVEHFESDLHKLGRDVQVLPVVTDGEDEGVTTAATFGAFSCPVEICTEALAQPRQGQGAQGRISLATIRLVPTQAGTVTVRLTDPLFVDVEGNPAEVSLDNTELTVQVTEEN